MLVLDCDICTTDVLVQKANSATFAEARAYARSEGWATRRGDVLHCPQCVENSKCASCGGKCLFVIDSWVCDRCGDEWPVDVWGRPR